MPVVADTALGRVAGFEEDGVRVFRGIPYAAPPCGDLRWRAPEPGSPWAGTRDATAAGPAAPHGRAMLADMLGIDEEWNEDCLTANVWAPSTPGSGRPVLVWIHGGSFTMGSGAWPMFDGAALVRRGDLVVVTFNYRLGALGFLAFESPDGDGLEANFGLLDQVAALRWVRENAAAFGGDPDRVTIFGESAGAMSAATLLAVPRARGLFRRAVLQSGAARNVHDRATALRLTRAFAEALSLPPDPARLREVPVERLLDAQQRTLEAARADVGLSGSLTFQPCVDGDLLPAPPLERIAAGAASDVALLVGTNLDEWKLFGLADPKAREMDAAGLLRRLRRRHPEPDAAGRDVAALLIETYREARAGSASVEPRELWFAMESDRWFRHPAMRLAELQTSRHRDTWSYLFTWPSPALGGALGSCHALEIPFVFGNLGGLVGERFVGVDAAARRLSAAMQDAWIAFAHTGAPDHPGLPAWPRYCGGARATLQLGPEIGALEAPLEAERVVWDAILERESGGA